MGQREEAVVESFLSHFRDGWPPDLDAPLALLASDVTYQVVVPITPPIIGRAAVREEWETMMARVSTQQHRLLAIGSGGQYVFTERVDRSQLGDTWADIPLCAVFEVNADGLITAWREYLDSGAVMAQHGISFDDLNLSG